ncbi:MAG TPA: CehA/McbA family metallohydrolase, partial [Acidimicrobiales bacterium]|nr:CehA/McbA family metallohydrolase [Acidimicrobiales bacterium]
MTALRKGTLHFARPEDPAGWYVPVFFDVPAAGLPGVRVAVSYPRDRARVDVGLWDPAGFRGWSGSERSELWVGPETATPGYLPGELPAGQWAVWLGLYVVPEDGVDIEITVTAAPPPPVAAPDGEPGPRPARRSLPTGPWGGTWLAGDLHCHTVHSDGAGTVGAVAAMARRAGLDFLAVTDHNTVSHHTELPAAAAATGVALLAGQEVTNYAGHANAFGPRRWIDFRRPADTWLDATAAEGGVLSVNHPTAGDCGWQLPLGRPPGLLELWPGGWNRRADASATALLEVFERLGRPAAVGGSDYHRPSGHEAIGRPTTWVLAEGVAPADLPARAGEASSSAGRSSAGGRAGSSGSDDLADVVLAGLAAGRTAVSS